MAHGAFCGGWAFERFRAPFEAAGHAVAAPDLLQAAAPNGGPAGLSMRDYARALAEAAQVSAEPPILIGHSMGALAGLMAAMRRRVSALILIAPSPPWGFFPASLPEAMAAAGPWLLGPYWAMSVAPDAAIARAYLLDRLSPEERRATQARLRPESGRAMWETLNWWLDPLATTLIEAARITVPVLALAGERDRIHPPGAVAAVARRLGGETRIFPGMSHWLIAEPGWEDVAGACLEWIEKLGEPPPRRRLTAAAGGG